MGQRGPWRSPEPQGALSVSEGLGGHPVSGSVRPGGLALRFVPTWGVTRGLMRCWPSTQPLLSQSWPLRHVFPLIAGLFSGCLGEGRAGGTSRRVWAVWGPSRTRRCFHTDCSSIHPGQTPEPLGDGTAQLAGRVSPGVLGGCREAGPTPWSPCCAGGRWHCGPFSCQTESANTRMNFVCAFNKFFLGRRLVSLCP